MGLTVLLLLATLLPVAAAMLAVRQLKKHPSVRWSAAFALGLLALRPAAVLHRWLVHGQLSEWELTTELLGLAASGALLVGVQWLAVLLDRTQESQDALREGEARYHSLFGNNHAAMLLIDPESGRVVDANPAASAFYGYSHEALLRLSIWDINTLSPSDISERMRQAAAGERQGFMFRHRLASGEERDVAVYSGPIPIEGRAMLYSIVHDITDQRRAEEALVAARDAAEAAADREAQSRATLQTILDTTPVSLLVAEAGTDGFIYLNHRALELVGGDLQAGLDSLLRSHKLVASDGRELAPDQIPLYRSLYLGEQVADLEVSVVRADGTEAVVLCHSAPVRDDEGHVTAAVTAMVDITERKRMEQALAEGHQTLEALLAQVPAGIVIADAPEVRVRRMSSYARGLGNRFADSPEGHTVEELARQTVSFRPGASQPAVAEEMPLYRAIHGRETITNEEWLLRTSQGDLVPVLCNATPITDDAGQVVGGVLIWRDIGDLKASQRALEEAYERERGIAQALQRSHQPKVPEQVGECTVAASYTPAYSNLLVGGDFFDAFETQDGRVCILIGDVSGKGIAAAALAAVSRSTLRALAFETSCPGQALTRANAAIFPQQEDAASFVTAVVAVLDPATGRLEFCTAGHPPAALRHASGKTEPVGNVGLPLGVLPDQDYGCHEAWLLPGDRLLLFTDGLLEARRVGEELGMERVLAMWGEEGGRPLKEAIERLVARASDWAEGKLQDDTALVALEWPGPPTP